MKTRLQQFLAAENISQSQFADTIAVARASVSHILSGRNKPSYEFLQNILKHYPNVNSEWLLTGRGRMYKEFTKVNLPQEAAPPPADMPLDLFSPLPEAAPDPPQAEQEPLIPAAGKAGAEKSQPQAVKNTGFPPQTTDKQRTIRKIIVFYSDSSFEEFARD